MCFMILNVYNCQFWNRIQVKSYQKKQYTRTVVFDKREGVRKLESDEGDYATQITI